MTYKIGDTSLCRSCGKPIEYIGPYWRHTTTSPRHDGIPTPSLSALRHPIQPLGLDGHGTLRFKANAIVRFLLDDGPNDMNRLAIMQFSREDQVQFAQLIGYSLSGFGDLSYVDDEDYERAASCKTVADWRK